MKETYAGTEIGGNVQLGKESSELTLEDKATVNKAMLVVEDVCTVEEKPHTPAL